MKQVQKKQLIKDAKKSNIEKYGSKTTVQEIYEGNFIKNAVSKAKDFFKKKYKDIKRSAKNIVKHLRQNASDKKEWARVAKPGAMIQYKYNAKDKTKKFDKQPLIISLGPSKQNKGNYYGINIHWLPVKDRVSIASFFIELKKKRKGKLTYNDIKPFLSKFKNHPALRQYIFKRVGNRVIYINDDELFLAAAAIDTADWFKP